MKKLFLVIGAPGSGKTTDADRIAKGSPEKIAHFSTGDMLRNEVASGSERGKVIDSFVSKGNLVPLEIVVGTIVGAIKNSDKDAVIIDGYPRSVDQMRALDSTLKNDPSVKLAAVIEVEVGEQTARDRVLGRARGADDNEQVFNNRMKVYLEPIEEIRRFYSVKNLLKKINGERAIEEIVEEMNAFVQSKI
ncbi:MAG: adenylate kinase [Helicobacteraceae bacterium]|jgi:adenylate kinase|nr:adenylate kinase [Helicobacteraceae bacterium]